MKKNEANVTNFINEMGRLLESNNPLLMVNMMKYNNNSSNNMNSNNNVNNNVNETSYTINSSNKKKQSGNVTNKENYLIFCVMRETKG